jgi:hypothetical protein
MSWTYYLFMGWAQVRIEFANNDISIGITYMCEQQCFGL